MFGNSLEVQGLGLRALTAGTRFFPFRELRSHKPLGGAKKNKKQWNIPAPHNYLFCLYFHPLIN